MKELWRGITTDSNEVKNSRKSYYHISQLCRKLETHFQLKGINEIFKIAELELIIMVTQDRKNRYCKRKRLGCCQIKKEILILFTLKST